MVQLRRMRRHLGCFMFTQINMTLSHQGTAFSMATVQTTAGISRDFQHVDIRHHGNHIYL